MNEARKEIFELISDAESAMGVPPGLLSKIYELEESVVHQRIRRIKEPIITMISDSINNSESAKPWSDQPPRTGGI